MKQLELFKKNIYSSRYYRNFSLYHMFNKGIVIPDDLIKCLPETESDRLTRIKEHNEKIYEKTNNS